MRTSRFTHAQLIVASAMMLLLGALAFVPAQAQERIYERALDVEPLDALLPPPTRLSNPALDAAFGIANMLDSAGSGVSNAAYMAAIQAAADADQPLALWELARMYETGEGIERDVAKSFALLERLVAAHANTSPHAIEADTIAQAFIRLGEFYRDGLPEIELEPDQGHAQTMFLHAATYFGNADAQFRMAKLYLEDARFGTNPLQGARWLSLSARKGHVAAQATLGQLLFNGVSGTARPVEGLMWLSVARLRVSNSDDTIWVIELHERALASATDDQRLEAEERATLLNTRFADK